MSRLSQSLTGRLLGLFGFKVIHKESSHPVLASRCTGSGEKCCTAEAGPSERLQGLNVTVDLNGLEGEET